MRSFSLALAGALLTVKLLSPRCCLVTSSKVQCSVAPLFLRLQFQESLCGCLIGLQPGER